MTNEEILDDMRSAFNADKNAGDPTGWAIGARPGHLSMTVPLDVQAPTLGTARLAFRAIEKTPEADSSISLIVTLQGRDLLAWRMEWRPLHTHTNMCGPKELKGLPSKTGIHDFECNAALGLLRMQTENLPLCIPVDEEPHDFDAFVRYAFDRLHVFRTEPILGPPWSATLF